MKDFERFNFICHEIRNMRVEEAEKYLQDHDITMRVVKKDNKPLIITCDYKVDRINVEVFDGRVVAVFGKG